MKIDWRAIDSTATLEGEWTTWKEVADKKPIQGSGREEVAPTFPRPPARRWRLRTAPRRRP